MTAFVTVADYEARYGAPAPATAAALLEDASDLIRAELRQAIAPAVEDDDLTIEGDGQRVLLLPELPAWAVASIVPIDEDGTDLAALVENTDYRLELGDDGRLGNVHRLPRGCVWGAGTR